MVSGTWLHAEADEHERKEAIVTKSDNMSMEGLQWTTAILRKVKGTFFISSVALFNFTGDNDLNLTSTILTPTLSFKLIAVLNK